MKNILLIILFSLIQSISFAGEPDRELHYKCIYPSVAVWLNDGTVRGSGVIVASRKVDAVYVNTVFTCNHILVNEKQVGIHIPIYENWSTLVKYETYEANVVRTDEVNDVAVLRFKSNRRLYTAAIDWKPRLYLGNEIVRVGLGQSQSPRLDCGQITSLREVGNRKQWVIRTNIYSVSGDSGAPVYHEGRLVGLQQSIHVLQDMGLVMPNGNISYYAPIDKAFSEQDVK